MKDFSINIAEDGGTIQVGDKTYRVTLITPAEQELKPVEGKWYRRVKEGSYHEFSVGKWYQYSNHGFNYLGQSSGASRLFDLSTPLDFDPETLVGKTLELNALEKFTVKEIEEGNYAGVGNAGEDEFYSVTYITNGVSIGKIKVLDSEPTLTVPESVEFVEWGECFALRYKGLVLSGEEQNFTLESGLDYLDPIKSLKLIPCKLEEVQNGEWVVNEERKNKSFHYRLKTEKGWVSFNGSGEYPIIIDSGLSDSINWLKVVQG